MGNIGDQFYDELNYIIKNKVVSQMEISKLSIIVLLCALAFNINADLLNSEILYDSSNNDSAEEYIELFNAEI